MFTDMSAPATVSSFRLDKYEITVGRFRKFVEAWSGGWRPPAGSGKHTHLNGGNGLAVTSGGYEPGWDGAWNSQLPTTMSDWNAHLTFVTYLSSWTASVGPNDNLPITLTNWYEEAAFCIWDEGFLPTEAEWNYAAAGGNQQRIYAWGATAPGANTALAIHGCYWGPGPGGVGNCLSGIENLAPVGSAPAGDGRFGQSDLIGNLFERVLDGRTSPYVSPCIDCVDLTSTPLHRGVRGKGFFSHPGLLYVSVRDWNDANGFGSVDGARCARSP